VDSSLGVGEHRHPCQRSSRPARYRHRCMRRASTVMSSARSILVFMAGDGPSSAAVVVNAGASRLLRTSPEQMAAPPYLDRPRRLPRTFRHRLIQFSTLYGSGLRPERAGLRRKLGRRRKLLPRFPHDPDNHCLTTDRLRH